MLSSAAQVLTSGLFWGRLSESFPGCQQITQRAQKALVAMLKILRLHRFEGENEGGTREMDLAIVYF